MMLTVFSNAFPDVTLVENHLTKSIEKTEKNSS